MAKIIETSKNSFCHTALDVVSLECKEEMSHQVQHDRNEINKVFRSSIILIALTILLFISCINPFAPALIDAEADALGDLKTIDGFFQSFQYAYNMQDTVVYSNLLAPNFIFGYRNYDNGLDLTLTREEDMITTYRLFNAAKNLNLTWNEIITKDGTDIEQNIFRNFNLTITFSPTDIVHITGRTYFTLKRNNENENWQLTYWRDDSYY